MLALVFVIASLSEVLLCPHTLYCVLHVFWFMLHASELVINTPNRIPLQLTLTRPVLRESRL